MAVVALVTKMVFVRFECPDVTEAGNKINSGGGGGGRAVPDVRGMGGVLCPTLGGWGACCARRWGGACCARRWGGGGRVPDVRLLWSYRPTGLLRGMIKRK